MFFLHYVTFFFSLLFSTVRICKCSFRSRGEKMCPITQSSNRLKTFLVMDRPQSICFDARNFFSAARKKKKREIKSGGEAKWETGPRQIFTSRAVPRGLFIDRLLCFPFLEPAWQTFASLSLLSDSEELFSYTSLKRRIDGRTVCLKVFYIC